jgi:hypothetical protein
VGREREKQAAKIRLNGPSQNPARGGPTQLADGVLSRA